MRRSFGWRSVGGAAALLAVAAALLAAFSLMSRADREELALGDSQDERFGWRYQVLVSGEARDYEPVFEEDGYTLTLPEGTEAVRITRAMTEAVPDAELEWYCYLDGVEATVDGEPLHTDFPGARRGGDGFLRPSEEDWDRLGREQNDALRRVRISLPADYLGRELTMTTYFPAGYAYPAPTYPHLGNAQSAIATFVVGCLRDNTAMVVYGFLALLMAAIFLLDVRNRGGDGRTLLLSLYFLLLFFRTAGASYSGYYSALRPFVDLDVSYEIYMAPLYLYMALRLKKWWKWPLCGCIAAWALYEGTRQVLRFRHGLTGVAYAVGPTALAVPLAVTAAFLAESLRGGGRTREDGKLRRGYALAAAAVTVGYLADRSRAWGGLGGYLDGVRETLLAGNFEPLVSFCTGVISVMMVIVVATEVIRRTVRTRRTMDVLGERARQTMAGYERLLAAEDGTRALHHEMRHHMTALSAILRSGDLERARRYVDAVSGGLEQLPAGRYCQNILVDIVAGSFLDRARAEKIRVEHHLNVPLSLNIADEDLSVFLSNMLQNALEACQRMKPEQERYIWVDMHQRGNFLCVQCANSAPDGEEKLREHPGHGYGLAAMRAVAEKYNSVLLVERTPGEFSVLSDFCLTEL